MVATIRRNSLFVDTSGWISLLDADEPSHEQAVSIYHDALAAARPLLTTTFLIAELVPALGRVQRRLKRPRLWLLETVDSIIANPYHDILHIDHATFVAAWDMLKRYSDKDRSLADATSFMTMRAHGLQEALAVDDDFTQAGFIALLSQKS